MTNRLAACLILGDAFREEELKKLFKSLEPHVNGIFVAYNGTEYEKDDIFDVLDEYLDRNLLRLNKFEWQENFALARQQSFDMVREQTGKNACEWMMWIDSDDIFHAPDGLEDMFESLDEYTKGIFLKYNYAVEPETGLVVVEQWRERILAADLDWKWIYPLHEVCAAPPGVQFARREEAWIEHLRKSGEDRGARDRNRKILAKWIREEPESPRAMFYFAGETMAEADSLESGAYKNQVIDAAIHAFEKYKELQPEITDDYYLANTRISDLYRMKNDHVKAIESDLTSIAIYPDWPDGYVGAAKSCMELNDFRRMKAFADISTRIAKPNTVASVEPMMTGFYPYFLRALACEHLGEYDQAIKDYRKARTFWEPTNGLIDDKIKLLKKKKQKGAAPAEINSLRKSLRGTKKEKSIAFYTSPIPEVWHPKTIAEGGSGGSELAVMEIARRFAEDGWRAVVFGTPGEEAGVYDGVEYWRAEDFLPSEPFHTFVSSRAPAPFEVEINAKNKFLWCHDVNMGETFYPVKDRPDKIISVSDWQANHISKLYGADSNKFITIPNGLNIDRFKRDRSKDGTVEPKFIWSSSPDRGLDVLLGLWPTIRKYYPEAELHVYYGWNLIDKIINNIRNRGASGGYLEYIKGQIIGKMIELGGEEGGIFNHGRVNQKELAEAMYKNSFWAYPTQFMETFCITALECQAAGVIPVTSKLAALQETVALSDLLVEGWPSNLDYQNRWLRLLFTLFDMPSEDIIKIREINRNFALQFTWDNAYEKWTKLVEDVK